MFQISRTYGQFRFIHEFDHSNEKTKQRVWSFKNLTFLIEEGTGNSFSTCVCAWQADRYRKRPTVEWKLRSLTDERTDRQTPISEWDMSAHLRQRISKSHFSRITTSVLEAVDFRAASASALPLPLPPKRSYFISSHPTHLFGSGWQKQPLPPPLPKYWLQRNHLANKSSTLCDFFDVVSDIVETVWDDGSPPLSIIASEALFALVFCR